MLTEKIALDLMLQTQKISILQLINIPIRRKTTKYVQKLPVIKIEFHCKIKTPLIAVKKRALN